MKCEDLRPKVEVKGQTGTATRGRFCPFPPHSHSLSTQLKLRESSEIYSKVNKVDSIGVNTMHEHKKFVVYVCVASRIPI